MPVYFDRMTNNSFGQGSPVNKVRGLLHPPIVIRAGFGIPN
jgi:hypothetical protein